MTARTARCAPQSFAPPSASSNAILPTCDGIQFTTPGTEGSAVPLIKEAIANGEPFRAHTFEYSLCHERHRAQHNQTQASLDQRPGRTDEPNHQGRDRPTILLR